MSRGVGNGPRGGKTTRAKTRWYGVVRTISDRSIEFDRYESVMDAVLASPRGEAVVIGNAPSLDRLVEERGRLEARIAEDELRLREVRTRLFTHELCSWAEPPDGDDNDGVDSAV
ncbi:MAG: hypothetical protein JWN44_2115 [Myxococcales bacterium]|nr:hypothetical protein [Myxococcales bacterium]